MNYSLLLLPLFLLLSNCLGAQRGERRERIQSLKVAYISQKIDLKPEQAQIFWPLYNKFKAEERALRREARKAPKALEEMSEAELNAFLNAQILREEKFLSLRRKMLDEYKGVLSLRQIAQLQEAERSFRREVLKQAKGRGHNQGLKADTDE